MQQGYPISEEMQERSDIDGKTYTVQYFQRAVFELHPEYAGTQYEVLLSLLGKLYYKEQFPKGEPYQEPNTSPGSILFQQTGKRLGGVFLQYWQQNGGLAQQGYPISDEFFFEYQQRRVQFFERAVFEYHPENKGSKYEVLLMHLGAIRYNGRYPKGAAPPYDVIYDTVWDINSRNPQDPTNRDIEFPRELMEYNLALRGMLVEGWQGWTNRGGARVNYDGVDYNVKVYMENPNTKDIREIYKYVRLNDVAREQAKKLNDWLAAHWDVQWPKVKISGQIALVDIDGHVELKNSSIEIIE